MEKLLYWLNDIKQQDRLQVGDKAFHLSQMMQHSFAVFPGFVISADVLQQFLDNLKSSEALIADLPDSSLHLDVDNWRQLQQVATSLRQEIMGATIPAQWVSEILKAIRELETEHLIFRPSLKISSKTQKLGNISGLLESQVSHCSEAAVTQALKSTWSQLFRARSLLYWQRFAIDLRKISFAVLVQPLQKAIASGKLIANSSGMEIAATWGLGIAIKRGDVLPDVYYIPRSDSSVAERHLGNKMVAYDFANSENSTAPENVSRLAREFNIPTLVEEAQQKQYALSEYYLQKLIQLANQITSQIGESFSFNWALSEINSTPKLYLTQISASDILSHNSDLIKGIAAATGRITAKAYVILNEQQKPEYIQPGEILVIKSITPDWLGLLRQAGGVITEQGGLTSHAAILARELNIPAVVNVAKATNYIQNGERLLLDGDKGEIYRMSKSEHHAEPTRQTSKKLKSNTPPPVLSHHSPIIATRLLINLSQSSLIEQVVSLPVDGVGLLRAEMMALGFLEGLDPYTWLIRGRKEKLLSCWCEEVIKFAGAFAPRPIFYRSLDWRDGNTPSHKSGIGKRGVLGYMENPEMFELELQALKNVQKAGYSNINLILPFVRTVEEFYFCRRKVIEAGLTQKAQFQLWIMAEVPSVLFLLPEYVKAGVQGIAIGTNDLTQLLFGIDREQECSQNEISARHSAVMNAVSQLIISAKNLGIPCSICGQAPSLYPEIIDNLVRWGITSISVEPDAVLKIHQAIARAEQRIILEVARGGMGNWGIGEAFM